MNGPLPRREAGRQSPPASGPHQTGGERAGFLPVAAGAKRAATAMGSEFSFSVLPIAARQRGEYCRTHAEAEEGRGVEPERQRK